MKELAKKAFWERVNYSTDLDFGKRIVERIFTDDEIRDKKVLDIGCGTGIYSLIFGERGARNVIGIDFSESSIIAARKLKKTGSENVQFLNADIQNHSFHEAPFDIIWCHGVIYYMHDPGEVMKKICRLTSSKGAIFISFMKNTRYSRIINFIRRILYCIPKGLRGGTSLFISVIFFIVLFIFNKKTSFSRVRTKILAQYFPVNSYFSAREAEYFFCKMGFKLEKNMRALDIFPGTTEFGLKLRKSA